MQTIADKIHIVRQAVHGEKQTAIENALSRIYPAEKLTLSQLQTRVIDGGIFYVHPQTGAVIGEVSIREAHEKKKVERSFYGREHIIRTSVPYKETVLLYAPQGHVDTRITLEKLTPVEGIDEKVLVITQIKEYYAPKKRRVHRHRRKTTKAHARQRSLDRRMARLFKLAWSSASNGNGRFRNNRKGHTALQQHDGFEKNTRKQMGKIRRDREFSLKRTNSMDNTPVSCAAYSLKGRMSKDRMNHTDGSYTVIQYAGTTYTTTHFSQAGRRLEQHSYNSEGELVKALGEAARSVVGRKGTPKPSGKVSAIRVRSRDATVELFNARRESLHNGYHPTASEANFWEGVKELPDYIPEALPVTVQTYFAKLALSLPTPKTDIRQFFQEARRNYDLLLPEVLLGYFRAQAENGLLPPDIEQSFKSYDRQKGQRYAYVSELLKRYLRDLCTPENHPHAPPRKVRAALMSLSKEHDLHDECRAYIESLRTKPHAIPPVSVREYLLTGTHPLDIAPVDIRQQPTHKPQVQAGLTLA